MCPYRRALAGSFPRSGPRVARDAADIRWCVGCREDGELSGREVGPDRGVEGEGKETEESGRPVTCNAGLASLDESEWLPSLRSERNTVTKRSDR
jgi:hypothetical protein